LQTSDARVAGHDIENAIDVVQDLRVSISARHIRSPGC
jgi:hypothetical protein